VRATPSPTACRWSSGTTGNPPVLRPVNRWSCRYRPPLCDRHRRSRRDGHRHTAAARAPTPSF